MFLSGTVNEILSLISQHLKRPRDTEHILLGATFMYALVGYSSVSIGTRHLKCHSFTNYKDVIGAKLKKTGHVSLNTPLLGVVCNRRLGFYRV